jgi:hypothetical protein
MPVWPIRGQSQERQGMVVQTRQKGNSCRYSSIILLSLIITAQDMQHQMSKPGK